MAGQENGVPAGLWIPITGTTSWEGTLPGGLATGGPDGLITGQPLVSRDRTATHHPGFCMGPETGNEDYSFLCQWVIPGDVVVTPVDDHPAALGGMPGYGQSRRHWSCLPCYWRILEGGPHDSNRYGV